MNSPGKIIFGFLFVLFALPVFAENLRGKLVAEITTMEEKTVQFPIDSLVGIDVKVTDDLLQGFELKLTVPPEIRQYRDSFVLQLYKNVSPTPDPSVMSYYGERLMKYVLPSLSKVYIQIPTSPANNLQGMQGTYIAHIIDAFDDFPLILSILPVMKGIPPVVYSAKFEMTVAPIFFPKGKLIISATDKDTGEEIDTTIGVVTIDEVEVANSDEAIPIRTGVHTLTLDIPGYQHESLNFTVEQGNTSTIAVALTRTTPTFTIEAPREAQVFIDGTLYGGIQGRVEEIPPGSHTVLFKIGDYSISKKIEIKEGKNYNISLFFDIFIKED